MAVEKFDWIIAGGGVSGIAIAELLCRDRMRVLLLEKNKQLVSETSKVFHEWMHSGALYSLVPDNLLTLRYLLGATDDLFEYYASFQQMNLFETESGVEVKSGGWFNNDYIEYRYRLRRMNPIWMSLVSRSINIIDLVSHHDWLRRRAGSEYGNSKIRMKYAVNKIFDQLFSSGRFYHKLSPDFTMNSRVLINDLLNSALENGLTVATDCSLSDLRDYNNKIVAKTQSGEFISDNIVICSPDILSKLYDIPIKIGYAPIAVVEGVPESETSFVELDYNIKKCINLLKKENGFGQAGGISLDNENDVKEYLQYVIKEHKLRNPGINVIDSYVGLKKELVQKGENRNYLYHINQHSQRIWSVVLGKFSLAFSMAPEFYRRVYHKNPLKQVSKISFGRKNRLISDTSWQEIVKNRRLK